MNTGAVIRQKNIVLTSSKPRSYDYFLYFFYNSNNILTNGATDRRNRRASVRFRVLWKIGIPYQRHFDKFIMYNTYARAYVVESRRLSLYMIGYMLYCYFLNGIKSIGKIMK
jgi:hypothetical protein